jgi:hypothetical protein
MGQHKCRESGSAANKHERSDAAEAIAVVTVRREKALDFSGCKSRPGTGSLHPVAIEAAAEATKLSELSNVEGRMATRRACRP